MRALVCSCSFCIAFALSSSKFFECNKIYRYFGPCGHPASITKWGIVSRCCEAAPKILEALIEQLKPGAKNGDLDLCSLFASQQWWIRNSDGSVSVSIRIETYVPYVPPTSQDDQLRGY
ncbi:protein-L-isoaspartate O-methyltransferase 1 [Senna tora]|uniref:Protein-L-isoaspartate O-methyltransferase 1 n=1 Tax=Senna tora TaxID=362788 RepID=A0A834XIP0_9FABA|nr:protein-L-isoaspartate O-methyltransferase 1 [Senna tora]